MTRPFVPRPYQELIIDQIIRTPRCNVWAGMGLGKTASVLAALDRLSLVEQVFPALVIAPLRVASTTWPDEVTKWADFNHLRLVTVIGTEKERVAALKSKADIYTINYENIPWLLGTLDALGMEWPFVTCVPDESTKLKGFRLRQGTKRARALARVSHTKVRRWINLTGTPSPNGLKDLWGQSWYIDAGHRLGRTFSAFEQRWFQKSFNGFGIDPLPFAQEQIEDKLQDVTQALNAADWFDLKLPIENSVYVDMPPKARALYDEMQKRMFAEIKGHEVEAFNAASKTMKSLQLANGAAYVGEDSEKWVEVHDAKIKALEDIIEEAAGMPVLVAYHFRSDLARLQRAFPSGRVLDKQPNTIRDWNAGRIPILFAHPASAGHGLSLQDGGNIIAFFSLDWNLENHLQIVERIGPTRQMQSGYDRPVFIYYILARDTVDDMILTRLKTKREVQDILLEAMNTNGKR